MIVRTVTEWGWLPVGDGENELRPAAAAELVAVARNSVLGGETGHGVLSLGHNRIQAGQVVGIVAARDHAVEILPKIEGLAQNQMREQLVHMLAVAHDLPIDAQRFALLSSQRITLLDLLVRLFAERLADTARHGLPKRYAQLEDDLPVLRGRLNVMRQFTVLPARPSRVACAYDEFSADVPINRIMKATVQVLAGWVQSSSVRRQLYELALLYEGVSDVPDSFLPWDAVHLDRTNAQWAGLLRFARLLLARRFQTTTSGPQSGFALLFEMNTLFEKYVERMLARGSQTLAFRVIGQGGGRYCLVDVDSGSSAFQTRPDILVRDGWRVVAIVDTKWKHPGAPQDAKRGIAQSDVYQMMAYAQVYGCDTLMLLYPHSREVAEREGVFATYRIAQGSSFLHAATIDVSRSVEIAQRLAALVAGVARRVPQTNVAMKGAVG